jgi:hypothetical protein
MRNYLDVITDDMMAADTQKSLLKFLAANPELDIANQLDKLKDNLNDGKVLLLQFEELYSTVDTLELQYEASRLRAKVVEYYVKQQKTKLSKKLAEASDSDQEKILSEVRSLDQLLKKVKDK